MPARHAAAPSRPPQPGPVLNGGGLACHTARPQDEAGCQHHLQALEQGMRGLGASVVRFLPQQAGLPLAQQASYCQGVSRPCACRFGSQWRQCRYLTVVAHYMAQLWPGDKQRSGPHLAGSRSISCSSSSDSSSYMPGLASHDDLSRLHVLHTGVTNRPSARSSIAIPHTHKASYDTVAAIIF